MRGMQYALSLFWRTILLLVCNSEIEKTLLQMVCIMDFVVYIVELLIVVFNIHMTYGCKIHGDPVVRALN